VINLDRHADLRAQQQLPIKIESKKHGMIDDQPSRSNIRQDFNSVRKSPRNLLDEGEHSGHETPSHDNSAQDFAFLESHSSTIVNLSIIIPEINF